jgi:acyl-CoA thioester hydrolase
MNYELLIKENHLDTFGHVNNAVYLQLFEEARWDFITKRGYGLDVVLSEQKGPVILEANIKFLKELKLRETIQITFEVVGSRTKIIQIRQLMLKNNGDVAAELLVTVGFFDLKERKLIAPNEKWLKVLIA